MGEYFIIDFEKKKSILIPLFLQRNRNRCVICNTNIVGSLEIRLDWHTLHRETLDQLLEHEQNQGRQQNQQQQQPQRQQIQQQQPVIVDMDMGFPRQDLVNLVTRMIEMTPNNEALHRFLRRRLL